MRRLGLAFLILWIHLGDLWVAWLYDGGSWPQAALLRPLRDGAVLALAALCLVGLRMPRAMLLSILAFGALAAAYVPAGYAHGLPAGIVVGSTGVMLVPMLILLAGYGCMPRWPDLRFGATCLVGLGIASTLFGAWDVENTDFWVDIVRLPQYLADIKGVMPKDTHPDNGLPWNYYGGEHLTRRAGGLVAAPLAQGQFLLTAALLVLGLGQRRWPKRALLACIVLMFGIWMSGTRGAMLAGIVSTLGYLLTSRALVRSGSVRILLSATALLAFVAASYGIVVASVNFRDGSTIGHWWALLRNLTDLHQVILLGGGMGRQSAVAAREGFSDLGGGEGAFFSIAYQMGLPAALLFTGFVGWCLRRLWQEHRAQGDGLALAMFWLTCGVMTTMVSSDNALTVSGAGGFWLLLGGVLRHCVRQARERDTPARAAPACPSTAHGAEGGT